MKPGQASSKPELGKIHATEAERLRGEALFLDVRTPAEYEEVHIEGSVLHPLSDFDVAKVKTLLGQEDRACVLICRSGNRASQAANKLVESGVGNLHILEGGVLSWQESDLPVNRGQKTMSLERQVRIAAGTLVAIGTVLGITLHAWFLVVPLFVGCGLVFAGVTDFCGMGLLLAKMPWNQRRKGSCCNAKGSVR